MEITGYELSRNFFDWSFENPEKVNTNQIALYFYIIEQCNRLGWKEKFGLPTDVAKEAIGIKNYRTYVNALNDLIEFGFIKMIEKSKNQHTSNVVAIVKNTKAHTKALDKAIPKHIQKQSQSTYKSKVTINKHITIEQLNIKPINIFDFKNEFLKIGVNEKIIIDWLKVRKLKKASNTETAFNAIKKEIELSGLTANMCIQKSAENGWSGFKAEWVKANCAKKLDYAPSGIDILQSPNRLKFD